MAGSVREHVGRSPDRKSPPARSVETFEHARHADEYVDMLRDFLECAITGRPPIASGSDALASVTLANAILLSGLKRRIVDLPIDPAEVEALLRHLQHR